MQFGAAATTNSSEVFGTLTLSASSTLDFGTPSGAGFQARFSDITALPSSSSPVMVTKWNGVPKQSGTGIPERDRLVFAPDTLSAGFTANQTTDQILFDIDGQFYNTIFL